MADEVCEQTLHISRNVDVFQIPPRAPSGWKSGEWLLSSKIFTGRLRVVSRGPDCEIRLEDAESDQLFACCPIAYGMRNVCVETVADSSRYFVLRVEDPATKRHAFLGMGFAQRGEAFDFNDSLVRHEKWVEREKASSQIAAQGGIQAPAAPAPGTKTPSQTIQAAAASKEMAGLYAHNTNLSLQAGQTITVNVKHKAAGNGQGKSWLNSGNSLVVPVPGQAPSPSGLFKLAPPPADLQSGATAPAIAPTTPASSWQAVGVSSPPGPAPQAPVDLLGGWDAPGPASKPPPPAPAPVPAPPTAAPQGWAVFD